MRKNKKPILLPIILLLAVVALSIGGVILAQNLRRARIENPGEIVNEDNIPRITAEEAYQAYTNRETIIVDTRSESSYANQHIAGAVNIPLEQIEERMGEMDPSKWVITYCT